jgi:UDP-2,4-diacetamido-2,4,6-trideoxy-beta-L-altropyranose hydrolase
MSQAAARPAAPLAVFRCDGSAAVGGGHLRRCLTLAEALQAQGWRCAFATAAASLAVLPRLAGSVEILPLDEALDAAGEAAAIGRRYPRCDWLIIDHYGRDAAFEHACRPFAARSLVIDDLADRAHDCDVLLDQTLRRRADDYRGLVPQRCQLLLGVEFALLRPEFVLARDDHAPSAVNAAPPYRLLVAMGLTDPDNLTTLALTALDGCPLPLVIDVVLGTAAPHRDTVAAQAARLAHPVRVLVDPPDLAAVMAVADLVIGTAGTSSWERCCLGLPSIALIAASNQQTIAAALAAAGAACVLQQGHATPPAELAAVVLALLRDPPRRAAMARRAASVCDGRGVERVVAQITSRLCGLKPAGPAAAA